MREDFSLCVRMFNFRLSIYPCVNHWIGLGKTIVFFPPALRVLPFHIVFRVQSTGAVTVGLGIIVLSGLPAFLMMRRPVRVLCPSAGVALIFLTTIPLPCAVVSVTDGRAEVEAHITARTKGMANTHNLAIVT